MGALDCVSANNNEKLANGESTEVFSISLSTNTLNVPKPDGGIEASDKMSSNIISLRWWKLCVDLPILVIGLITVGLFEFGIIPGHKAGFFCKDPSLSHKFEGDTVTTGILVSSLVFLPPLIIFSTEFVLNEHQFSRISLSLKTMLPLYVIYIYGLIANMNVVAIMKGVVGSPRPCFFDICKPDTGFTCNGSEFVSTFQCTSEEFSSWFQIDSYRSFPSGHTSSSVYCGLFIAWYLQKRAFSWKNKSILLVPLLQFLAVCYSIICSLTRITDHRHHWWDVLAGCFIGVLSAVYIVKIVIKNNTTSGSDHTAFNNVNVDANRGLV